MILLPLRTPPVNPLWMKTIRILLKKVRTLNTNQKIVMTALAVTMTPSTKRECALKVRIGFLKNSATTNDVAESQMLPQIERTNLTKSIIALYCLNFSIA